ncbi:MAG: hypothetical protein ACRDKG_11315 [Actinomycetota bacterium]
MTRRARKSLALLALFGALAGFYAATFSFRSISDSSLNSLQTRALIEHGDIDLAAYPETETFVRPDLVARQVVPRDDAVYSIYGAGISIVAAPIYAPLIHLGVSEALLQGTVGVLFVTGSVVLLYALLLRIVPAVTASAATAIFAFGTTMWTVASMAFFPQGPVVFFECFGLMGLFSRKTWGPAVAGFGLGTATFIRPSAAIPLLLVGGLYLVQDRRQAAMFALGAALPLFAVVLQNRVFWGSWFSGGYSEHGVGFRAPWPSSLFRILFGWWRGIFVYSPVLLISVAGLLIVARRPKGFIERRLLVLGLSSLVTIVVTSKWSAWHGGLHQFGYRLLIEILPFLIILGAFAVSHVPRLVPTAMLLGIVSILTMTWGAAPSRNGWDGKLFARDFADTSIGQAWIVFLDHPWEGLARLVGVASLAMLMILLSRFFKSASSPELATEA